MRIETKYDIGDEVWIMILGECYQLRVVGISTTTLKGYKSTNYYVSEDGEDLSFTFEESVLFPTKEELLKSL